VEDEEGGGGGGGRGGGGVGGGAGGGGGGVIVNTLAGSHEQGHEDGEEVLARFDQPWALLVVPTNSLLVDQRGRLLVADWCVFYAILCHMPLCAIL
jgi:hypothetical protein